jgi:hypothetical protein
MMSVRVLLLLFISFSLVGCAKHDATYYATHPTVLEQAMARCPMTSLGELDCDQLKKIALRMNELAYQLRLNQQQYGQQIIALQEQKSMYEMQLKKNPNQPDLERDLSTLNQNIEERLFIVKWLESPGGKVL